MLPIQSVEILKKLDKKELKRFGDFLSSPYFNQSDLILKIFEAVKKEYPEFKGNFLQSEKMFKKLYPSDEFKETRIQNLYSEFGRLLREFIGYEQINKAKYELDVYIAEGFTERNLSIIANKFVYKKLEESGGNLLSERTSFHSLYRLVSAVNHNLDYLRMQGSIEHQKIRKKEEDVLVGFFFRDLCMQSYTSLSNKKLFTSTENDSSVENLFEAINQEKLFKYLKQSNSPYYSYIKVFYRLYLYTKNDITPQDYFELKKDIFDIVYSVPKIDALMFIVTAIQIVLAKLIPIDRKYYTEVFILSELFCALNIFPNEKVKYLAAGPFRDMFTVAVILKEYDWAENFVKEQSQFLSKDIRENELNFCLGNLSFKRGKYEESLNYFNKVEMIDIIEKINIRFYYMMNYIELKAYESAIASLNTIRQFYHDRRDEIPEMFAVLIPDSLRYFNEIIKCEEQGIKMDEMLYKESKDGRRFYHIAYILKKMEKLM